MTDVLLVIRRLRASMSHTAAVVLTLALAVGAATAMFSAVAAVLLGPTGVADQGQVVVGWGVDTRRSSSLIELTYNDVAAIGAASPALTATAAVGASTWSAILEDGDQPTRVEHAGVSGTFFEALQVQPVLGRLLTPADDVRGGADVAVLSHAAWQRRFGADPGIVGRTLRLDGDLATVVGVAPPGFDFPRGAEFWMPLAPGLARSGAQWRTDPFEYVGILLLVGRLAPGATLSQAAEQLTSAGHARDASRQVPLTGQRIALEPFQDHVVGPARQAMIALFAAVVVLLLVACANVSGLMLTQAARRGREDAVQLALGADVRVLVRQRLLEAAILAAAGGALGLAGARSAMAPLLALAPDGIPRLAEAAIDLRVAAFAAGVTAAALLLIAVAPARHLRRLNVVDGLADGGRTASARHAVRTRAALLVVQTALAVVLLVAAGVLVRSFLELRRLDVGVRPDGVLTVRLDPRFDDPGESRRWMQGLLDELQPRPGVRAAGAVYLRPMARGAIGQGTWVLLDDQPQTGEQSARNPVLNYQVATPGYFAAMGIPLRRGRLFDARDDERGERVVLVSQGTADRLWPGQDPIGKRLLTSSFDRREGAPPNAWRRVIGVVANVPYRGLGQPSLDLYDPAAQSPMPAHDLVVRADGAAPAIAAMVAAAARASRPGVVVHSTQTLDGILARAVAPWRFSAWVFSLFGGGAFLLALFGLVSVVALDVAHRRHEFAIRLAVGASRGDIARRAVATAALRVALGLGLGLAASAGVVAALRGLLFGVSPFDWATYAGVPLLVLIAAGCAAAFPVRAAVRTDPAQVLRNV